MSIAEKGVKVAVPKLRFPEFRGAPVWVVENLSDVAEFINEKISISKLQPSDYVSTENLLPGYGEVELASRLPTVSSVTRFKRSDVLISNIRPYLKKVWRADWDGGASNDVVVLRAKPSLSAKFFSLVVRNDAFIAYVMGSARGVKMPRGDVAAMRDYAVAYPKPAEQQKVAECLTSLDELTAAQGQKVEALKAHKRGLFQQLFPREGESRPRLRFPEFRNAGEWAGKPLGDVATFHNGRAYAKDELLERGKYQVVRVGNFFTNDHWYYSDLELGDSKYCDEGDLLYAWSASFGPRIWHGRRAIYHYHLWKVVESVGIARDFLFYRLISETERMKDQAANGIGMFHITKGTIENWISSFPEIAEQHRIASCLSSLDSQITEETAQLAALKTHKQGLMQQLFPAQGAG